MADGVFRKGSIEFSQTIERIDLAPGINPEVGPYLIPGLVDIHTHGALGKDYTDGNAEDMYDIAAFYAKNGVTSFLGATLTATEETIANAMVALSKYKRQANGARCLGVNMEGPFFSHGKRGAHQAALLQNPTMKMFERMYKLSGESIKMVCVAPELDGALDFIKEASKICKVSLAHTEAGYDMAMKGFDSGATIATHLLNGMNQFQNREPSVLGAAMDAGAFVEIICDGHHLHPATIRGIFKMFPERVCLISDSIRCAGLPDGDYTSAGFPIIVKNGSANLKEGGSLAGSTITLMQGVRVAVSLGIPLATAVTAATAHSAQAIGMEDKVGSIKPGAYADFVILDSKLNVQKVYINGEEVL